MAAASWTCKCGHENVPESENFHRARCEACGRNRFLPFYIGGVAGIVLLVVVILAVVMLRFPKQQVTAAIQRAAADGTITNEERQQIDEVARRWRVAPSVVADLVKEIGPPPPLPPSPAPPREAPQPPRKPDTDLTKARQYFQQGVALAAVGRLEEAIKEFSATIDLDPNHAAAYANRGVAYTVQKKYNKAQDDLKKAVDLDPKDRNAFYNLAVLHTLQKQFDRAIDALDQALTLGFDNYDALRNDRDLVELRKQPEFRKTLERHKIFF